MVMVVVVMVVIGINTTPARSGIGCAITRHEQGVMNMVALGYHL